MLIFPTRVQGEGAAAEVVAALRDANRVAPRLDVLVVARGGGSLEDLWTFNEEPVVRAIAASRVPTVSAIGHEIDVTLADLAADVRALTPTEAGERVAPSADEAAEAVQSLGHRLRRALTGELEQRRSRLTALADRPVLRRPLDALMLRARRADELSLRLHAAVRNVAVQRRAQTAALAGKLDALSPLGVLSRGYSLTLAEDGERLVTAANQLRPGDRVVTRLFRGRVTSRVEELHREDLHE